MLQCIYPASTADDYHATMLDAAVWNSATLRHAEDVPKQRGSAGKDAQSGFAWNAAAALRRARAQSNGWTVEDPYQIPGKPETHGSRFRCGELTTQTRSSSILEPDGMAEPEAGRAPTTAGRGRRPAVPPRWCPHPQQLLARSGGTAVLFRGNEMGIGRRPPY
jgi:hypothetical protein